jgi:23S rRNA (adenine2503-C2)-methyltransferase
MTTTQVDSTKTSLLSFTYSDLESELKSHKAPSYLAGQVMDWIYKKRVLDPQKWTNVSPLWRQHFLQHYTGNLPTILWKGTSIDGTRKYLIKFHDQLTVEAVLIDSPDRLTLCLSSQVGCAMGCVFCHTATQGLKRHLKAYEIVGQYFVLESLLQQESPSTSQKPWCIDHIVYMGQGEPLHNFDEVRQSLLIFLDTKGLALGQRRITVSTSGLVPQILKWDTFPPVNLAISLHAIRNELRTSLMPINKAYDLDRLLQAIETIPLKAHRHITYEYLLLKDLNDQEEDIKGLVRLLNKKKSKVNIIPFNEYPGSLYKRPDEKTILWFAEELNARGLTATVRKTKGKDILAACGQLKSTYEKVTVESHP